MDHLRYPVGKFSPPEVFTEEFKLDCIQSIQNFPLSLRDKLKGINKEDLEKKYREGGWNVRQIIQHCADSHLNAFTRFKLTLTEEKPTIKNYNQDAWVSRKEMETEPIEWSVAFIENLHLKWVHMLKNISVEEYKLQFFHPEFKKELNLGFLTSLYSWHCKHHLGHIDIALSNEN